LPAPAIGNIVFLLPLERLHLRLGQHLAGLGNMSLHADRRFLNESSMNVN
jgi:hypothetical protein